MDLMEAIKSRRAVRDFTEEPVDRGTVERLIETAILAPSAMNLQPWAFSVLLDRDRIAGYGERAKRWLLESHSQLGVAGHALELPRGDLVLFHGAPALVIVLATSAEAQAAEDCCLAAENLMLAARALNLGTCWIGLARPWLNLPSTKAELGLAEPHRIVAPIVLGYPKAWPDPHQRRQAQIQWL